MKHEINLSNTGLANGAKAECKAVTTEDMHSSKGNSSRSSSVKELHLAINGVISA